MATEVSASGNDRQFTGQEASEGPGDQEGVHHDGPGRPGSRPNMVQVAKLLTRTEERLVKTERELIDAVRRTIAVTESMIALVRSTTSTTQTLMAPLRDVDGCEGIARCARKSLHCLCDRVAVAKQLVRVVEGLNHTAGSLNEATDFMIKLSNSLSPREDLTCSCVDFLISKVEAAETLDKNITKVQHVLEWRLQRLKAAAGALEGDEGGEADVDRETPEQQVERNQAVTSAVEDFKAMTEGALDAVAALTGTSHILRTTIEFLQGVMLELQRLQCLQVCPEAGALLLEELECPVCYQASAPPEGPTMWTCVNGHVLCASCRGGVVTCPSCRGPLTPRPATLLTAWASSLRAWCPHRHRGCAALLSLADRAKHLEACEHRDDDCPADAMVPDNNVPSCLERDCEGSEESRRLATDDVSVSRDPGNNSSADLVWESISAVSEVTLTPAVASASTLSASPTTGAEAPTTETPAVASVQNEQLITHPEQNTDSLPERASRSRRSKLRTRWKVCCVM